MGTGAEASWGPAAMGVTAWPGLGGVPWAPVPSLGLMSSLPAEVAFPPYLS